jgi:DNA polymerase
MSLNDDAERILSQAQSFLRQQQELYGDTLILDLQRADMSKARPSPPTSKSAPVAVPAPESDLFGTNVLLPYPAEPWTAAADLTALNAQICNCQKCGLGSTRNKFVFGVGNPNAEVVVVGEAPGADEDEQGEPFVGRAGQLLNKILEAVHFRREDVYICNILKCRPPNNRDPQPEESESCEPYLWKQLELIKPKMILCAGRIAGQSLLRTNASLTQLRGKVHDYRGIRLMVTYHPAALLRNPNWKRPCWEDVQMFRRIYDELKAVERPA